MKHLPRPTTATTAKAEPEPPAAAKIVWAQHTDDHGQIIQIQALQN